MSKKKKQQEKVFSTSYIFLSVLILFFLSFFLFIVYNFIYSTKIFPNIYVADVNLSGNSVEKAYSVIDEKFSSYLSSNTKLIVSDDQVILNPKTFGVTLDTEKTILKAYKLGRSGNFLTDSIFRIKCLFVSTHLQSEYKLDASIFDASFNSNLQKFNENVADAKLSYNDGVVQISDEHIGKVVDESILIEDFKKNIADLKLDPINIKFIEVEPYIKKENLASVQKNINALIGKDILLSFGEDRWHLTNSDLFRMLKFYPENYENENLLNLNFGNKQMFVKSFLISNSTPSTLSFHFEQDKIDTFISSIAVNINRQAKDATLKFEGGKVSEFSPAQDGQALNKDLLKQKVLSMLTSEEIVANKQVSILLPVSVTRAKIANDEINKLGIKELIGKGVSYFAHSIPNRAWNVGLGTSRVSGTLIAPGEIFSFNRSVGEVSGATGYRQAYVISEGKTVLDDGGGICQVSTTVFRAALNAGLPIISRTAHAYRVSYYEQNGSKPGFDATVFAPSVDLQFKNDTDHSILIQAVADQNLARLEVDIYGTGDGRRVQISDPVISNQIPALPDKRQDDPTLPVGQVKQVDFSAAGATAVFTRKVYKGNDLMLDDVFKSVYRPWAAVYLVGTKS